LDIKQGDFYIEANFYNSSYSYLGKTIPPIDKFPSGTEELEFINKSYSIDLSGFPDVRYIKIVYRWWHPTETPSGSVWVDDLFLGPLVNCKGSAREYKCEEITVKKVSGMGDVYPYFSAEVISAGTYVYLKDSNCLGIDCRYIISSPTSTVRVNCFQE
jgi:hypothetical protein